jgi:hypothetical protein
VQMMSRAPKISEALQNTLHRAFVEARDQRHTIVTVEHLLAALIQDESARPVLVACGADLDKLADGLNEFIKKKASIIPSDVEALTEPTVAFRRVLTRAIMHVNSTNPKGQVDGANCLLAVYGEKDSWAVGFLQRQGVSHLDVVNYMSHGITKAPAVKSPEANLVEPTKDPIWEAAKKAASKASGSASISTAGLRVFISYSHLDARCLERLLVHLKPLERQKLIDPWSDRKLRAGDKWQKEIEQKLHGAAVAVLLISADFLASDFIANNELPPLLLKAEARGLRIIPVILKPCGFLRDNILKNFQAANDPSKPLLGMTEIEQEFLYDKIAAEIHSEILLRTREWLTSGTA